MSFPANRTEVKAGNLTISNLRRVDSGLYQCVATNGMGTKKATMNLIVQQGGLYICFIISNLENLPRLIKIVKVYYQLKLHTGLIITTENYLEYVHRTTSVADLFKISNGAYLGPVPLVTSKDCHLYYAVLYERFYFL